MVERHARDAMLDWLPTAERLSYKGEAKKATLDLTDDIVYREVITYADFVPLSRFVRAAGRRYSARTLWKFCHTNDCLVLCAARNKRNMIAAVVARADAITGENRIHALYVAAPYHTTNVLPRLLLAVRLELPEYPSVCEVDRADTILQTELPNLGWKLTAGDESEETTKWEYRISPLIRIRDTTTGEADCKQSKAASKS